MLRLDFDEKCFLDVVKSKIPEYDINEPLFILDVGAASGHYTEYIRNCFWNVNQLRFHLFEPVPFQFEKLSELYKDVLTIKLNNMAVSDSFGLQTFVVAPNLEHSHIRYDNPTVETRQVVDVEVTSIDSYLSKNCLLGANILLIKIDVEGNEFHVLKGAIDLLSSSSAPRFIQAEYGSWWEWSDLGHMKDCIDFLNGFGYNAFEYLESEKKITPVSSASFNEDYGMRNLLFERMK